MNTTTPQLSLPLTIRDSAAFDNFIAHKSEEAVSLLRQLASPVTPQSAVYLWGVPETGKTHLLHALCHHVSERKGRVFYLPLADTGLKPEMLETTNPVSVYCIDDVGNVASNIRWQQALFGLFESCRHNGAHFVATGNAPPTKLGLTLSDLSSRLQSQYVFQLKPLTDEQKMLVLNNRAREKGLELSEDVTQYILRRYPRNTGQLFGLLDKLDHASLAAQRKITIPFLKTLEN